MGVGQQGGGGVEADSSSGPETQLIRAGVSESLTQLRADMRWWFAVSNHDVKIVILTKFDQQQSKVIIEKWEAQELAAARLGAITTRRAATLQPILLQTIEITRNTTTDPVSYDATGGALELEFSPLFLRNPGPLEGDVVVSVQALQEYARRVWSQG
ncbi:Ceramide glucosyltransferase [Hypoxylon texense]